MSTQQVIRQRLRSVHNILHITEAMEIVASVQFRKVMHRMEHFRAYASALSEIVSRLNSADVDKHPLMQERPVQRIGVVVIAGDKGLCGAYNQNVFTETEKLLKTFSKDRVELVLFGKKALEHFSRRQWHIRKSHVDYIKKLTEGNISDWSNQLTADFQNGQYEELWVVYTHFKNVLSRDALVEKLLPIKQEHHSNMPESVFIFEPDPQQLYQHIIPYFFYTIMESRLLESYASELSSRMIAMKEAAKNAEEMIEKLTLIKNKNRQLSITNEILEITAGAESLK